MTVNDDFADFASEDADDGAANSAGKHSQKDVSSQLLGITAGDWVEFSVNRKGRLVGSGVGRVPLQTVAQFSWAPSQRAMQI